MAAPPPRLRPQQPALPARKFGAAITIEDQVRAAFYTPDPQTYHADNSYSHYISEPKKGGRISAGVHPSPLDHHHKTRAHVPGPGAYHTTELGAFALPEGGRVNRNAPVQKQVYHDDYPKPAPCDYGVPHDPARPRQVSGQFSKDPRVSKFIMDEVTRVKHNPGPGAHDVMEAMEASKPFCPEGGRVPGLVGPKPPNYVDNAVALVRDNPGPDAYNKPDSINANKAVGKLVYRYESATMMESRDLVNRLTSDDGPGPGTYEIPDMQPTPGVASMKGRTLPYAMPHPFAYNCAPDTAGRFTKSLGVLQRNSGDQIYGNGVRKNVGLHSGIPKQPGRGSRPASSPGKGGDTLNEQELRSNVPVLASEQPAEGDVEWKAGGFAQLKKSRSAGSVQQKEHPSVLEASKCYPKLQKRFRESSQFLPMASRRTESVRTHDASNEHSHMNRGKWQLGALASDLQKATSSVLNPLDEERLKKEAMHGLQEKAKERMRLEGVSKKQQQAVLQEMRGVLAEQVKGVTLRQRQQQQHSQQEPEPEQESQQPQSEDQLELQPEEQPDSVPSQSDEDL